MKILLLIISVKYSGQAVMDSQGSLKTREDISRQFVSSYEDAAIKKYQHNSNRELSFSTAKYDLYEIEVPDLKIKVVEIPTLEFKTK